MRVHKVFRVAEKLVRELEIEEPNVEVKIGDLTYKVSRQTIRIHLHRRRQKRGWSITLNIDPRQLPPTIRHNKIRVKKIRKITMLD